jgi:hypothetical protein
LISKFSFSVTVTELFTKRGLNICHASSYTNEENKIILKYHSHPQKIKTNFGERRFSAPGPFSWNRMPESIREAKTIDAFKCLLKAWLFGGSAVSR